MSVGVYCHLVALKDAVIPAQSLAGASSRVLLSSL